MYSLDAAHLPQCAEKGVHLIFILTQTSAQQFGDYAQGEGGDTVFADSDGEQALDPSLRQWLLGGGLLKRIWFTRFNKGRFQFRWLRPRDRGNSH